MFHRVEREFLLVTLPEMYCSYCEYLFHDWLACKKIHAIADNSCRPSQ